MKNIVFILALFLFVSCETNEAIEPEIETQTVQLIITPTGSLNPIFIDVITDDEHIIDTSYGRWITEITTSSLKVETLHYSWAQIEVVNNGNYATLVIGEYKLKVDTLLSQINY